MLLQGEKINVIDVQPFVDKVLGDSEHEKRKRSIANAVLGVINSASLIVYRIGNGLAAAKDLFGKHAIKQVDRLLSDKKFIPWNCFAYYVKVNTAKRRSLSLFTQGCHYFNKLIRTKLENAKKFMDCFIELLDEHKNFQGILWII